MPAIEIVTTAARPDLIGEVSVWLWREWGIRRGRTREEVAARLASHTAAQGPEQTFVLLEDAQPAATASFVHHDLDPRPDLSPWLASVYVHPDFRGRGHAPRVVGAVEASAKAAGIATLYLDTNTVAPLYARLGWVAFAESTDLGQIVTLMRRDL
jgi:GNAT superfamily N-acetyltransferase